MDIDGLLRDKDIKNKEKTETLASWLIDGKLKTEEWLYYAQKAKDPAKATCMEAMEFASKQKPAIVDLKCFDFVCASLTDKAPRIKWESARVIGNVAKLFPLKLEVAVTNLLNNTEHPGTVVRWSAALALGEILALKTKLNKDLLPAIEAICEREEKNSIKKIYAKAIKLAAK